MNLMIMQWLFRKSMKMLNVSKFKMLFFSDQNEQVYLSGSSTNTYTGVKIIRLGAT